MKTSLCTFTAALAALAALPARAADDKPAARDDKNEKSQLRVLATAPDTETYVIADLDLPRQDRIRTDLPSLANRRPEIYEGDR